MLFARFFAILQIAILQKPRMYAIIFRIDAEKGNV